MSRWRFPSLSLHGIQGAFYEPGSKTVIPRKVSGKFSIRLVPNQTPEKINQLVKEHMDRMWKLRDSPNHMRVRIAFAALSLTHFLILFPSLVETVSKGYPRYVNCKQKLTISFEELLTTNEIPFISLKRYGYFLLIIILLIWFKGGLKSFLWTSFNFVMVSNGQTYVLWIYKW